MNVLELAKKKVCDDESLEEDSTVVVTSNGNFICE